jgi:PAP2 superfamily
MFRTWLAQPHSGAAELGGLAVLYGVYEVVRGFGGENYAAAFANTRDIVELEQRLGVFAEQGIQQAAESVQLLPALLGLAYVALHFAGTALALVWVHRSRREHFPIVRTTLITSTAFALVGYILYPAAPPRLADLGFSDTVSSATGLNLSSDLLGSLYNPIAAVPSLHFGYAVIVGAVLAHLADRRWVRVAGWLYPVAMLGIIVATGNHFFLDAAAGGLVVVLGWITARSLVAAADRRAATA